MTFSKVGFGDSINAKKTMRGRFINPALNHVQRVSIVPSQSQAPLTRVHETTNSLYIPVKHTFLLLQLSRSRYVHFFHSYRNELLNNLTVSVPDNEWWFCSGDVHYLFSGRPVTDWSGKPYNESTSLTQALEDITALCQKC